MIFFLLSWADIFLLKLLVPTVTPPLLKCTVIVPYPLWVFLFLLMKSLKFLSPDTPIPLFSIWGKASSLLLFPWNCSPQSGKTLGRNWLPADVSMETQAPGLHHCLHYPWHKAPGKRHRIHTLHVTIVQRLFSSFLHPHPPKKTNKQPKTNPPTPKCQQSSFSRLTYRTNSAALLWSWWSWLTGPDD